MIVGLENIKPVFSACYVIIKFCVRSLPIVDRERVRQTFAHNKTTKSCIELGANLWNSEENCLLRGGPDEVCPSKTGHGQLFDSEAGAAYTPGEQFNWHGQIGRP